MVFNPWGFDETEENEAPDNLALAMEEIVQYCEEYGREIVLDIQEMSFPETGDTAVLMVMTMLREGEPHTGMLPYTAGLVKAVKPLLDPPFLYQDFVAVEQEDGTNPVEVLRVGFPLFFSRS